MEERGMGGYGREGACMVGGGVSPSLPREKGTPRAQVKILDLFFLELAMYNTTCSSSSTSCEASGGPFVSAHFGLFC